MPYPLFHYIDGGADDEITLRHNTSAFEKYRLIPNALADVSKLNTSTTVLGQKIDWPVILSPTAISRLFHHHGEVGVARQAAKSGTIYCLSTISTDSIEEVASASSGPKVFQIYIHKDRGMTRDFVERCKQSGYVALCLTVDTLVAGNRERDLRFGMSTPPKFGLSELMSFATHPTWTLNYLLGRRFKLGNVSHRIEMGSTKHSSVVEYINSQFDRSTTWRDAEELIKLWNGPFAIKGIMSVADALKAIDVGASAIMISNHGGRQMDGATAPIEQLAEIADATAGKIEIILDGGVRRGTHVLKSLCLGAKACMIGRGYLYAHAAAGEKGVSRILSRLKQEIERDMLLMGCANLKDLDRDKLLVD